MLKFYFIGITLTLLVLCFHTTEAKRRSKNPRKKNNNNSTEFDQFGLSQSWPQTTCWDLNYKRSQLSRDYTCDPCKHPLKNNNWTLHGLWPNRISGAHPFFCTDEPLNLSLLSEDLLTEMRRYWPTYKLHFSDLDFWKHEWTKHGTCALQSEQTNSEPKYFAKALELLHQYNIGNILQESEVMPGHEYSLKTIYDAINEALGVNVYVSCARLPGTGNQYIEQVLTCFDKDFNLIDCHKDNASNCQPNQNIVYPKMMRSC